MVIEWHSPACSCPCALCLPVLSPSVDVSAPWTQDIKIACICGDSQLTLVTSWASCRGSTVGWGRWAGYRHSGQPARWSRSANKHCCKVKCYLDIVFAEPMPIHNTTQSTLSLTVSDILWCRKQHPAIYNVLMVFFTFHLHQEQRISLAPCSILMHYLNLFF